jgi:predicted RNase H-like HicB family nuclease
VTKPKIPLPVVITEERIRRKKYFVAWCPVVDVVSQGRTYDEAMRNIEEALELYFEDPDAKKISLVSINVSLANVFTPVPKGVLKNVRKATGSFG